MTSVLANAPLFPILRVHSRRELLPFLLSYYTAQQSSSQQIESDSAIRSGLAEVIPPCDDNRSPTCEFESHHGYQFPQLHHLKRK